MTNNNQRSFMLMWGAYLLLALTAGFAMTSLGYTVEAGYFWPRQAIILGILAIPLIMTSRQTR